jgi:hypothetical protein
MLLFGLLAAALPARAALDPELKKPYKLLVVLDVADHRALTPLFKEELERTLGDQLRQGLGAVAEVRVQSSHLLLGEIAARGLEQALDGLDQTSDTQTHFLVLDYSGGLYRLAARAHDGMTGQVSAVVRRVETGDPAVVPRLAVQLVEQAFGPVGTVTAVKGKGDAIEEVQLALKAGALGPLPVKRGDVFAVSKVVAHSGKPRAVRADWAVLEVLDPPEDGVCRCRYYRRYREDDLRDGPGILGWRALRIATTPGPVRLRVLDEDTAQPLGQSVEVRRAGSKEKGEQLTPDRDGLAITRQSFTHLAEVRVVGTPLWLPVPRIDGWTVVCRVKLKEGSEALAGLEYRRDAWVRRVYDNLRVASDGAKDLSRKLSQSLKAAEEQAKEDLKNLDDELTALTQEHGKLKQEMADAKPAPAKLDLRAGEQGLAELRQRRDKLNSFVERAGKAIQEGEENAALNQLLEQARLLEAKADYKQAIALYEQVVQKRPNQTDIREHLDALKQGWSIKNKDHEKARAFVYDTWPTIEVAALKENLETARKAVETLKAAGDRLTARKMAQANIDHVRKLNEEEERLKKKFSVDNINRRKVIREVAAVLAQLHTEITALAGPRKE